jgi:glucose-1-phosphate cytidylyltransferase
MSRCAGKAEAVMKVVLLAGGLGSRLAEETTRVPKPMVEIGGQPIIMHVMDIYSHWGFRDFVVAGGYKCMSIKAFFQNFHLSTADFTVALGSGFMTLKPTRPLDWNVSVVDTGTSTMTGGRLLQLREWIGDETFMVTYSDGLGNIDLEALLAFHRSHGRLATVTAVQPPARFGGLKLEGDRVDEFTEKVTTRETWINGGFFVFEPGVLDYIPGMLEPLELSPLSNLAKDGQLFAFKHDGFWHPMDTIRDRDHLHGLCDANPPPWLDFAPNYVHHIPRIALSGDGRVHERVHG